jgi:hypothetical protein
MDAAEVGGVDSTERNYQLSYTMWMLCHAIELGCNDANHAAFYDWFKQWFLGPVENPSEIILEWVIDNYSHATRDSLTGHTAIPEGWADFYKYNALVSPVVVLSLGTSCYRAVSGSIAVSNSGTVGTGRTITFANSYFTTGSFYVGGYIAEYSGTVAQFDVTGLGSLTGYAVITAVNSPTQVVVTIIDAFTSGSLTASKVMIPGPAPADYADEWHPASGF